MSDLLTNVFASDLFSTTALVAAVNKMPHVPGQAGALGIFPTQGVTTTSIVIEEQDGVVRLIPDTPRGAPPNRVESKRRKAYSIRMPHFPTAWAIAADQLQNVRAFGSASMQQTLERVRDQELGNHVASLDATVEYGRIGALKGVIYDADGSTVLLNLFDAFGVTQDTTHNFALTTAGTEVHEKCTAV
ncbi:MAG: major capsid protein, partial [Rhodospirillaceae bacterium]|nr:major capsid protein [Rhodospirillaceae bacterium]